MPDGDFDSDGTPDSFEVETNAERPQDFFPLRLHLGKKLEQARPVISHASTSSLMRDAKQGVPASGCTAGMTFLIELQDAGSVGARITERMTVGSAPMAKNPVIRPADQGRKRW